MNIFAVDEDPVKCAKVLDDRRVVKMTTETAQMISDAIRTIGGNPFYEKCNPNHPCSKWVGRTQGNFLWALALLKSLNDEYRRRYERDYDHGAFRKGYMTALKQVHLFPEGERTEFQNSSLFKEEKNVIFAYRRTMVYKWNNYKLPPRWTKTRKPKWAGLDNIM